MTYKELKRHIGHEIVCVQYSATLNDKEPQSVAIECETCNEVLISKDHE